MQIVASTQEFTVPESYPFPVHTPPVGKALSYLGKKRAKGDEELDDLRGNFPIFRPFKSGLFDENATYSGNFGAVAGSSDPSDPPRPRSYHCDPLSVQLNPPNHLGHLFYVELSERWVFVCGGEGLRVFARGKEFFDHSDVLTRVKENFGYSLEPGQLALRIVSDRIHYARWQAFLAGESFREHWGSELVRQQVGWNYEVQSKTEDEANRLDPSSGSRRPPSAVMGMEPSRRRVKLHDEVLAVHVSPDQKHFVAMFSSSRLLFVPNFERVIAGETSVWHSGVDIQLGPVKTQSVYLSYGVGESGSGGGAGRITVVTVSSNGQFVATAFLTLCRFLTRRKLAFSLSLRTSGRQQHFQGGRWTLLFIGSHRRSWTPNDCEISRVCR